MREVFGKKPYQQCRRLGGSVDGGENELGPRKKRKLVEAVWLRVARKRRFPDLAWSTIGRICIKGTKVAVWF